MLTNECLFAYHDTCSVPEWCECLCHVQQEEMFKGLMDFLMEGQDD